MKTFFKYATVVIISSLLTIGSSWAISPKPPKINASAYILQDHNSGKVLAELNADQRIPPASLTKMMAAYTVEMDLRLGNIKLEDKVKISRKARYMTGSRMFVEQGSFVTVEDLLKGIIIQSGNDATIALAEHIAGGEDSFVALMNAYAQKLGMENTNFVNATGLPHRRHYSTVRDLAILSNHIIRDFPEHYKLYSEKEFTYNGITQRNRNSMLWRDDTVDGIKTGHTNSAGFCLAASAERNGMRLVSVVVGTRSERARATESQKLLTHGYRFFETHKLYASNQSLTDVRIWKGMTEKLPLGLTEDLYITIPRGDYKKLKATLSIDEQILAPASKGNTYGSVNITLHNDVIEKRDLVALQSVPQGSIFNKVLDEVLLVFE